MWSENSQGICTLETPPAQTTASADPSRDPSRPRGRRRYVAELAAITGSVEACLAPGASLSLHIEIGADGRIRNFRGPVATSDEQDRVSAALAPVIIRSVAGPASFETSFPAPPAPPSAGGDAPASADLGGWFEERLDAERDAVFACVGADVVAVRLQARDGQATWSLQGAQSGTPEEECVASVLGGSEPPANGTLIRVLR